MLHFGHGHVACFHILTPLSSAQAGQSALISVMTKINKHAAISSGNNWLYWSRSRGLPVTHAIKSQAIIRKMGYHVQKPLQPHWHISLWPEIGLGGDGDGRAGGKTTAKRFLRSCFLSGAQVCANNAHQMLHARTQVTDVQSMEGLSNPILNSIQVQRDWYHPGPMQRS